MRANFFASLAITLIECTSCNDQNKELAQLRRDVAVLHGNIEQLRKELRTCQARDKSLLTDSAECNNKLAECIKRANSNPSATGSSTAVEYFRARSAQLIELVTSVQRDRIRELSLLIERTSGTNPVIASFLEESIYRSIRDNHTKWIQNFNYNPLNKKQQVIDPAKAILLYKKFALQLLKTHGLESKEQYYGLLESVFGEGTGHLMADLPEQEIEKLTNGGNR